jgi:hypothetical protein
VIPKGNGTQEELAAWVLEMAREYPARKCRVQVKDRLLFTVWEGEVEVVNGLLTAQTAPLLKVLKRALLTARSWMNETVSGPCLGERELQGGRSKLRNLYE